MKLLATVAASLVVAAGCSSSKASHAGSVTPSSSGHKPLTVGVLTDLTGPASSVNKTSVEGIKAGIILAARDGYPVKYVVADTATNPANTLSAAQKLVTQDHVAAVIAISVLTFTASSYFTAHHVPVIGLAGDGPEWTTSTNMFSTVGALHTTKVTTTAGAFFRSQGVTNLASIGYSISPASAEAAKAEAESAKAAGIKVGYLNAQFPFGSTDVQPLVLAMKKAGVDGLTMAIDPNTAFALITGLRQAGVDLKAALLPAGYGGDLIQAGPGALKAAQNVFFSLGFEPVEMNTTATKQFRSDLTAAGVPGEPTFAQYNGYMAVGLLVQGRRAAGADPSPAALITGLSTIHDFTGLGLYGSHHLDVNDRTNIATGVDNCLWITKLEGSVFRTIPNADPICGTVIPGRTVSPSS